MSSQRFKNKVCLVTASSTGIGFAISRRLAQEGATVIISSRKEENVLKAVKSLKDEGFPKVGGFVCHVGNERQRTEMVKYIYNKYGRIDVLVLNAAISTSMGELLDTPSDQMDKMFSINVKAAILLTSECMPLLEKSKTPSIVIISSYTAIQPSQVIGFYGITKTALLGLNKALAQELQPKGIRVNCVSPGLIKTNFSSALWKSSEETTKETMGLERLGEVEDVANAVVFLVSPAGRFITGETLMVDGGVLCGL